MQTAQTPNFVKPHMGHRDKHPQLGELCWQTAAYTHFVRLIEKINCQQKPKNDPSQDKHPESLLWSRQAP